MADERSSGQGQPQQRKSPRGRVQTTAPSLLEWGIAAIGLLLLLATLGYLAYQAVAMPHRPPEPVAQVLGVERQARGFLVRVRVSNRGTETAAALKLQGVLRRGAEVVEQSETEIQYLPAGSSREGGIFFSRDPAQFTLEVAPRGYEKP